MEKALKKRRETITVTLRIDKDIMNKLALDAENDSISLNSLVNHVLKKDMLNGINLKINHQ